MLFFLGLSFFFFLVIVPTHPRASSRQLCNYLAGGLCVRASSCHAAFVSGQPRVPPTATGASSSSEPDSVGPAVYLSLYRLSACSLLHPCTPLLSCQSLLPWIAPHNCTLPFNQGSLRPMRPCTHGLLQRHHCSEQSRDLLRYMWGRAYPRSAHTACAFSVWRPWPRSLSCA